MTGEASADAPIDLRLLPRTAAVDGDGRLSIGGLRSRRARAVVRHTSLCVRRGRAARLDAASTAPRSATARSPTPARRSSAWRWRGSSPRKGSTSTSRPAVRRTSRTGPAFPPTRMVFHGNNKSELELRFALELGVGTAGRRRRRRARPHRGARRERAARDRECSCASPPASKRTPTSTSPPAPTTRSSASPCRAARRATRRCAWRRATRWTSSASTATSARRSSCSSRIARGGDRRRARGRSCRRGRRADRRDQPRRWPGRPVHVRRSRCASDRGLRVVGAHVVRRRVRGGWSRSCAASRRRSRAFHRRAGRRHPLLASGR